MINDILDLAKVEAGRMELSCTRFSLGKAFQDVHAIVKTLANKKGISLRFEPPDGDAIVYADLSKFKQVLFNLVSNAIKFTPDHGSVEVTARIRPEDAALEVDVCDSGIGIKPEDHERVFVEFEQIDSSYSRRQQGTGLGLAITKRIVELHGGRIWVASDGIEGQGSTFTFVLPCLERAAGRDSDPSTAPSIEQQPALL